MKKKEWIDHYYKLPFISEIQTYYVVRIVVVIALFLVFFSIMEQDRSILLFVSVATFVILMGIVIIRTMDWQPIKITDKGLVIRGKLINYSKIEKIEVLVPHYVWGQGGVSFSKIHVKVKNADFNETLIDEAGCLNNLENLQKIGFSLHQERGALPLTKYSLVRKK